MHLHSPVLRPRAGPHTAPVSTPGWGLLPACVYRPHIAAPSGSVTARLLPCPRSSRNSVALAGWRPPTVRGTHKMKNARCLLIQDLGTRRAGSTGGWLPSPPDSHCPMLPSLLRVLVDELSLSDPLHPYLSSLPLPLLPSSQRPPKRAPRQTPTSVRH